MFTLESEEDAPDHHQYPQLIDRQVIGRYLLDFLNLEVNGGPADKKVAAIATAVQVLGMGEHDCMLIQEYSRKLRRQKNVPEKENGELQNKLYRYLTEE